MKKTLIVLTLASVGGASQANSASFDCSKAKSFAEKTICSSPKLSKDDDDLKYLYWNAKSSVKDRKAFSEITKTLWSSRERCSDYSCVDEWYDTAFAIYGAIKEKGIPETNGVTDFAKEPEASTGKKNTESRKNNTKKDFSLYDSKERAAPVEHNAVLYKDTAEAFEFIDTLVGFVRQSSYKCDSVSSFVPMVLSNGFTLSCNKFSYKYEIKNNGGNISVSVDN
ncbi:MULTISPECIES: lysozyme inhibitor LprI family protein [unclassified Cedecea]|uniref:lysozyme inhibitor LprI family protein n=1 Tax=unclassified Cedecea TaxID=2649846 RepID=UPI0030176090